MRTFPGGSTRWLWAEVYLQLADQGAGSGAVGVEAGLACSLSLGWEVMGGTSRWAELCGRPSGLPPLPLPPGPRRGTWERGRPAWLTGGNSSLGVCTWGASPQPLLGGLWHEAWEEATPLSQKVTHSRKAFSPRRATTKKKKKRCCLVKSDMMKNRFKFQALVCLFYRELPRSLLGPLKLGRA